MCCESLEYLRAHCEGIPAITHDFLARLMPVGSRISVELYITARKKQWYDGEITAVSRGLHTVKYDDGEEKTHDLLYLHDGGIEQWCVE